MAASGQPFDPDEVNSKERGRVEPYPHHWAVPPNIPKDKTFVTRAMWEPPENYKYDKEFIPEMVPELIVPDLDGFKVGLLPPQRS